ncbi:ribosome maturation factor RimP [Gloeobacter kilaueensis]|uniref:Ribosome maturation factor RimP n=1 Tax=Gloeobacter kilaueensis (strain ATCC BAA-2537 / CCAP 1431/1 / ULC 316 / JS1) TaxID=1183438 RepID=U5QGX4_GLOK1|nr:ribosome maturation factor RimP [Gloeobacter kilaueensis]AGY56849.1 ribosome maturation factor RimP [Gloeobacter kilaueensis JS1]
MKPHDIVEQVTALAEPLAAELGLQLVAVAFQTHTRPATLRVDIRHPTSDTGLDDCERMSRALEARLDAQDIVAGAYNLEVSSPGVERVLTSDREFVAFRGFAVIVKTFAPVGGKKQWEGRLLERDEANVYFTVGGRRVALPREQVARVQLIHASHSS